MSDKMTVSLHTLPVEIVYQILDNLTTKALFISTRNVCQRLDTIINSYHRYLVKLDFLIFFGKKNLFNQSIVDWKVIPTQHSIRSLRISETNQIIFKKTIEINEHIIYTNYSSCAYPVIDENLWSKQFLFFKEPFTFDKVPRYRANSI